jgi:hypothetical protein
MRRAIYEYTKGDGGEAGDTNTQLPELLLDAWGDQPLAALPKPKQK